MIYGKRERGHRNKITFRLPDDVYLFLNNYAYDNGFSSMNAGLTHLIRRLRKKSDATVTPKRDMLQ